MICNYNLTSVLGWSTSAAEEIVSIADLILAVERF